MTAILAEPALSRYDEVISRHWNWVASKQDAAGVFHGWEATCSSYMPYPLYGHATGRLDVADKACRNLEKSLRQGVLIQPDRVGTMMPYIPGWIVMGAVLTENLRLSTAVLKYLLTFQDPAGGGFYGTVADRDAGRGVIDFDATTQACVALCLGGQEAAAIKCGQYLKRLLQAQPDPSRMYLQWDTRTGGLVKEFEPQKDFAHVLVYAAHKAHTYKIGLLARALAFVAGVTGEPSYFDLAESYYRRTVEASPDIWTNTLAHKMAWGAWTLFRLTGRRSYAEDAMKMADHLVTLQQPDGGFSYPEIWPTYEEMPWDGKINICTQFATWIVYARSMAAVIA